MANVTFGEHFKEMIDHLIIHLKQEIVTDEKVNSWPLMKSPWPILSISAIYLLFVLKVGPKLMEKREPLKMKYIIRAYNLMQMMYNSAMCLNVFIPGAIEAMIGTMCHPPAAEMFKLQYWYFALVWYFMFSKILDLIDTVFFVLRKKQSHVSFLHVYHHVNMVITSWIFCKFFMRPYGAFPGLMNCFVHAVMYSYYFLSSLGPKMKKYLWWKKYLTRLQIAQFIVGLTFIIVLFINDCDFPRLFTAYMAVDVSLFLYLFVVFYKNTYSKKSKSQ